MTEEVFARALVTLADCGVKSVVILGGARLVVRLLPRSAAVRHLVWQVAFIILLLLPLLSRFAPASADAHVITRVTVPREASLTVEPEAQESAPPGVNPGHTAWVLMQSSHREGPPARSRPARDLGAYLMTGAFILWLSGASWFGLRLALAYLAILRLRRLSSPGARQRIDLSRLATRVGLRRECELRTSIYARPSTAMTWGIFRPVILLPHSSAGWADQMLEAVLLHELAHVRRRDCFTQLLAGAVCAVYWFNPFVWVCARALRAEAERAADDLALDSGVRPSTYAEGLLGLAATGAGRGPSPVGYVLSIVDGSTIESRIKAIVEPSHRRHGVKSVEGVAAVAAGLLTLLLLMPYRSIGLASGTPGSAVRQDVAWGKSLSGEPDSHGNDARSQPARPAPAAEEPGLRRDREAPAPGSVKSPAHDIMAAPARRTSDQATGRVSVRVTEDGAGVLKAGVPNPDVAAGTHRRDGASSQAAGHPDANPGRRSVYERRGADLLTTGSPSRTEEEERLRPKGGADLFRRESEPPSAATRETSTRPRPADVISRSP